MCAGRHFRHAIRRVRRLGTVLKARRSCQKAAERRRLVSSGLPVVYTKYVLVVAAPTALFLVSSCLYNLPIRQVLLFFVQKGDQIAYLVPPAVRIRHRFLIRWPRHSTNCDTSLECRSFTTASGDKEPSTVSFCTTLQHRHVELGRACIYINLG